MDERTRRLLENQVCLVPKNTRRNFACRFLGCS